MQTSEERIKELEEQVERLKGFIRTVFYEKIPDVPFICGTVGKVGEDGMPEGYLICPAYGVDFSYHYVKKDVIVNEH